MSFIKWEIISRDISGKYTRVKTYPQHPDELRYKYVYEHRVVIENNIERLLEKNEVVHHLNSDRHDNRIENLQLTTKSDHAKIHIFERIKKFGFCIRQNEFGAGKRIYAVKPYINIKCIICGKEVSTKNQKQKYCSYECSHKATRKVERPSSEELYKLVWEMSTIKVAKIFGVSDKAVKKWCDSYGIEKPPRGYWAKKAAGKI
jgi:DNA-directed RNA polymerase subunit RPC12/RpoP